MAEPGPPDRTHADPAADRDLVASVFDNTGPVGAGSGPSVFESTAPVLDAGTTLTSDAGTLMADSPDTSGDSGDTSRDSFLSDLGWDGGDVLAG